MLPASCAALSPAMRKRSCEKKQLSRHAAGGASWRDHDQLPPTHRNTDTVWNVARTSRPPLGLELPRRLRRSVARICGAIRVRASCRGSAGFRSDTAASRSSRLSPSSSSNQKKELGFLPFTGGFRAFLSTHTSECCDEWLHLCRYDRHSLMSSP